MTLAGPLTPVGRRRVFRLAVAVLTCAWGASEAVAQSPAQAVPVFDLSIRIRTDVPGIEVEGQVTVPPRNRSVESVDIDLDRRIRDFEVSVVSPPGSSGRATAVRQRNSAIVTLAAPVPAGSAITLQFKYSIGENSSRSFYIARDGVLFSGESAAWYPRPSSHRRSTGRLRFLSPDGVTVVSTGRQIGSRDADGSVRFEVNEPTTFSLAAGRHQIYTSPGDPSVALHLLTPRSRAGERLALIRRILTVLVDEFGGYPHPDLEVVEMPNAAMGGPGSGTSLEGFLVISPDVIDRASLLTLAHEIAHQWWSDSVFAVGQSPVLLGETMANYGGLRALEGIYGERAAAEVRWRGFPGEPPITGGRGYLNLSRAGLDEALMSTSVEGLVAGSKGMLVHDLLSRTIGRERFKTILRNFTRDHAFQDTPWQVFADAVRAAEPGIGWFIDQWYGRSGAPSWTVSWSQQGGEVTGAITQSAPFFRADVEVVLRGLQDRERHQLRIEGSRTEFAWRVGYSVAAVEVDPDYKVPHDSPDRTAEVDTMSGLGQAVRAARGGADFNTALRAALREGDFLREAILGEDAFGRGEWETARVHIDTALAHRSPLPEMLPGLYYMRALLARQRGDRGAVEPAARAAIDADARLLVPSGYALPARELLDAVAAVAPAVAHAEIRDSSIDALPDVRIPVSPDLVLAVVDVGTLDVAFRFRFRPDSFDSATTRLVVDLDIDQDAATGTAGVEYQIFVVPSTRLADVAQTIKPYATARSPDVPNGSLPVTCVADGCDVTVPRRLLGNDDGRFDFRVRVFADPLATTVLDVLPDVGFVRLQ